MPAKLTQDEIERRQREGKFCITCKEFRSREHWNTNRSRPDGLLHPCKTCNAFRLATYRLTDKGRIAERRRESRRLHPRVLKPKHLLYRNSLARKECQQRYANSDAGKLSHKLAYKRWSITDKGKATSRRGMLHANYGKGAVAVSAFLLAASKGISPLTGLPLLAPTLDHCHQSGLVRGLVNDLDNVRLSRWAGDSYITALKSLETLKTRNGPKELFLKQALLYFLNPPAKKLGLEWVVTGRRGRPEHQHPKTKKFIQASNAGSLRRATDTLAKVA